MNKKIFFFISFTNLISLASGFFVGSSVNKMMDDIGWADALSTYRMGAESGCPESQYYVGLYTHEGKGVERNDKDAFYWMSKAAKNGYLQAQIKLAWMYGNGIGVPKDERKAIFLYKTAAENAEKQLRSNPE